MSKATVAVEGFISEPRSAVTGTGKRVLNVNIAHEPKRKNRTTGEWESVQDQNGDKVVLWAEAAFWDDTADLLAMTLTKGTLVRVEGEPRLSVFVDRDGVSRPKLEVLFASLSIVPLPPRSPQGGFAQPSQDAWGQGAPAGQQGWAQPQQPAQQPAQQHPFGGFDENQPF